MYGELEVDSDGDGFGDFNVTLTGYSTSSQLTSTDFQFLLI